MNFSTRILFFLLNIQFFLIPSFAQEDALDSSFGQDGIVKSLFYGGAAFAQTSVVQPDGKILIAGYSNVVIDDENSSDFFVIRLNSNGSIDYTFGVDGKVTTDFSLETPGVMNDYAMDMVLQPDGKIIVAGFTYLNGYAIMARYNSDGSIDTSFGTDGKVRTSARDLDNIYSLGISSIVLQSDGKIVLGGTVYYTVSPPEPVNYNRLALFRYNPDGSLDTSYGTDGVSTYQFEAYNEISDSYTKWNSSITSIAIQPDDKIVAVGNASGSASHERDCVIARFNPTGNIDFTFAGDGIRVLRSSEDHKDSAADVVILPNGNIIMVGRTIRLDMDLGNFFEKYPLIMAQFSNSGSLIANFGANGIVTDDLRGVGAVNRANAVSVQSDGKIVVAGSSQDLESFSTSDFALVRYNSNGTRDVSFGNQGKTFLSFAGKYPPSPGMIAEDDVNSLAIQADGRILLVGTGLVDGAKKMAIARYTDEGVLDTEFSSDGKLSMGLKKIQSYPYSLALQTDEKIVAAGYAPNYGYAFIRYFSDGKIDSTFNSDGRVYVYMDGAHSAKKILIQSDGKILAVGTAKKPSSTNAITALLRLNEDGSRDEDFGDQGKVISEFSCQYSSANTGVLQNDGKIVIGGRANLPTTGRHFLVQRYNADGSPDESFGLEGSVVTNFVDDDYCEIFAIELQPDSKIVAAGKADSQFTLARYNTNGTLDLSFGVDGIIQTDFGGRSEISDIAIQSNGKITVGGHVYESFNYKFALARYNSNGTLDTSFGASGKVTTDFGFDSDERSYNQDKIRSIAYQDDGKLIAFGRSGPKDHLATFVSVRYNVDGSIDTSFGENGVITTSSDDDRWMAKAAILQPDNKLLALGNFTNDEETGFALARYHLDGAPVGIEQIVNTNNSINVYPNPSSGIFSVNTSEYTISKLKVINLLGQEVWEQTTSLAKGEVETVNLSSENKGIFFLHLETDSGRKLVEKIVIK